MGLRLDGRRRRLDFEVHLVLGLGLVGCVMVVCHIDNLQLKGIEMMATGSLRNGAKWMRCPGSTVPARPCQIDLVCRRLGYGWCFVAERRVVEGRASKCLLGAEEAKMDFRRGWDLNEIWRNRRWSGLVDRLGLPTLGI